MTLEEVLDAMIRLVPDKEHPEKFSAIDVFIDGRWCVLTNGDNDQINNMHADLCLAVEQAFAALLKSLKTP